MNRARVGANLAEVSPGDSDSVGDRGKMQPRSNVNRATRTARFHARLVRGVVALKKKKKTNNHDTVPENVSGNDCPDSILGA